MVVDTYPGRCRMIPSWARSSRSMSFAWSRGRVGKTLMNVTTLLSVAICGIRELLPLGRAQPHQVRPVFVGLRDRHDRVGQLGEPGLAGPCPVVLRRLPLAGQQPVPGVRRGLSQLLAEIAGRRGDPVAYRLVRRQETVLRAVGAPQEQHHAHRSGHGASGMSAVTESRLVPATGSTP